MVIAVRKEPNGSIYIDKGIVYREILGERVIDDYTLTLPPYNFKLVNVDYADCEASDFNDDLTFNTDKYWERLKKGENSNRITELKKLLRDTDYQAIKFAEGQISEEDYAPIKKQRQEWRNEINRLQI